MKWIALTSILACSLFPATLSAETQESKEKAKKESKSKPAKTKVYPMAFVHKKGYVISPYRPYNIIDVRHLSPGDHACDPSTATINPKTGKLDLLTGKIFVIPKHVEKKVVTKKPTKPQS